MYKAVYIRTGSGIALSSTDTKTLDYLANELKKIYKKSRITYPHQTPNGKTYWCLVDRLDGQDKEAAYWLFTLLCEQDWQPISFDAGVEDGAVYKLIKHED